MQDSGHRCMMSLSFSFQSTPHLISGANLSCSVALVPCTENGRYSGSASLARACRRATTASTMVV